MHSNNTNDDDDDVMMIMMMMIIIIIIIAQQTGDERKTAFLFHRLSVLVQRFNCVLLHDSFVDDDCPD